MLKVNRQYYLHFLVIFASMMEIDTVVNKQPETIDPILQTAATAMEAYEAVKKQLAIESIAMRNSSIINPLYHMLSCLFEINYPIVPPGRFFFPFDFGQKEIRYGLGEPVIEFISYVGGGEGTKRSIVATEKCEFFISDMPNESDVDRLTRISKWCLLMGQKHNAEVCKLMIENSEIHIETLAKLIYELYASHNKRALNGTIRFSMRKNRTQFFMITYTANKVRLLKSFDLITADETPDQQYTRLRKMCDDYLANPNRFFSN